MSSASVDCQFIFVFTVFLSTNFFNLPKYFSIGAISGMYGGMKASLHLQFFMNAIISLLLCVAALTRIIKAQSIDTFHTSSVILPRLFKYFRNNEEFTEPFVPTTNTFHDDEIAVIREVELLNQIFANSEASPFIDHEYIVFVDLEKDDSSTIIKTSN